jgi:bidirectional [NiFe] hydrogenase diaphorase subunit
MVELKINGKSVKAERGETILNVARREGFVIPSLCHHETLGSDGRCRLCIVEVQKGNRKRMVTSCLYFVENGVEVLTETEDINLVRRTVIELLLARCPNSEVIQYLAKQYRIDKVRYTKDNDKGKCILCNLCVKTCEIIVGVTALCLAGTGPYKKATTPFDEASDVCIGCGACVVVCPTGHIYMEDNNGIRTVWRKSFELAKCPRCGRHHTPIEQLQFISQKSGTPIDDLMICQNCK